MQTSCLRLSVQLHVHAGRTLRCRVPCRSWSVTGPVWTTTCVRPWSGRSTGRAAMTETWGAWEMPGGERARTVAQILAAGPGPEERRQARQEQAVEDARRGESRDAADAAAAAAFRARIN